MPQTAVKTKAVEQATDGADRNPLLDYVRKVLLASIGAVALAQDEMEDFVNKLVERGQIAEQDARKLIKDVTERRTRTTAKAEETLDRRVEDLLSHMNVPTKTDLDMLSAKISALTKKVEELKKA